MDDAIDALLEETLLGAHGDDDQLTAFEQAFKAVARFPFPARVADARVEVTSVVYDRNQRGGLFAICNRGHEQDRVALADVTSGPVTLETSMLIEAYRRWRKTERAGRTGDAHVRRPWAYVPLATRRVALASPLALRAHGLWDPAEQYWGEPDEELHPLVVEIIAAGARPQFEMEQVLPGVDEDDWDSDPVADAAELHRGGADRQATRILEDLLAQDERCIDAWVHLGNIALAARGPTAAVELYDRAVAIGEQSLHGGFGSVPPYDLIDNRPFLRALYGLGLCAWRQRRWDDAERIFLSRAWLEGAGTWDAIWCWERVRARQRWSRE